MTLVLVIVGGALGALARFYTERASVRRFRERVPYGTAIVNLAGAVILAAVVALVQRGVLPHEVQVLIGTGFCGALTTFSGFIGQIDNRLRHASTRGLAIRYGSWVTFGGIALAGLTMYLLA